MRDLMKTLSLQPLVETDCVVSVQEEGPDPNLTVLPPLC